METLFEIRFRSKPDRLCLVRTLVKRTLEYVGCCTALTNELVIAVNEACTNVVKHAYQDDVTGEIVLEMLNNEGELHFKIVDYARPIDLDTIKSRDLNELRPGGLGIHFINEIMDKCDWGHLEGGKGNYLEMIKRIH